MVKFLKDNVDVFAWQPYNMPCIDSEVMFYMRHINPTTKPIKQKPRRASPEKAKTIEDEVQKLLKARAIQEVEFQTGSPTQ